MSVTMGDDACHLFTCSSQLSHSCGFFSSNRAIRFVIQEKRGGMCGECALWGSRRSFHLPRHKKELAKVRGGHR